MGSKRIPEQKCKKQYLYLGKMENPVNVNGMGVAKSGGNKFNSILHTCVLQIKDFWGHHLKKQAILRFFKYLWSQISLFCMRITHPDNSIHFRWKLRTSSYWWPPKPRHYFKQSEHQHCFTISLADLFDFVSVYNAATIAFTKWTFGCFFILVTSTTKALLQKRGTSTLFHNFSCRFVGFCSSLQCRY